MERDMFACSQDSSVLHRLRRMHTVYRCVRARFVLQDRKEKGQRAVQTPQGCL